MMPVTTDEQSTANQGSIIDVLLEHNKEWVAGQLAQDKQYLVNLAKGQHPHSFWIGCADSRVPASVITGSHAGELFEHRNIANLVVHDDLNMLSALQYAVEVLQVAHVIVCGHYGCGGVKAALGHQNFGLINKWLRYIKDVYRLNQTELEDDTDPQVVERRMIELNVIESVHNLAKMSIIQQAWTRGQPLTLHGGVYDLGDGLLRDLRADMSNADTFEDIYKYDL